MRRNHSRRVRVKRESNDGEKVIEKKREKKKAFSLQYHIK